MRRASRTAAAAGAKHAWTRFRRVQAPHAPRAAPQITGPTSSPEFKLSILPADKYRPFSPASPPVKVIVPHGRPETTFDIKYFTRERRRVHLPAINTGARKHLLVDARAEATISPAPAPGTRVLPSPDSR